LLNRRQLALGVACTAIAACVPALAAPAPILPGNHGALIETIRVVNSVRFNEVGEPVIAQTMTLIHVDGFQEEIKDPAVIRFVMKRFHRQMVEAAQTPSPVT
jgi:hypothetical protein